MDPHKARATQPEGLPSDAARTQRPRRVAGPRRPATCRPLFSLLFPRTLFPKSRGATTNGAGVPTLGGCFSPALRSLFTPRCSKSRLHFLTLNYLPLRGSGSIVLYCNCFSRASSKLLLRRVKRAAVGHSASHRSKEAEHRAYVTGEPCNVMSCQG